MPSRAAESQSESEAIVSEPSQPFQPREDDDETLYEVIEITRESKGRYKVRWKGNDPKTNKPWPQSWVAKHDCTDDLVLAWKWAEKQKKERRKSRKSGRNSTSTKPTSRSVASTARINSRSKSVATTSNIAMRREERSPSAGPSNLKSKSKRRFEDYSVKEENDFEGADERNLLLSQPSRPSVSFGRSNVRSPTPPSDAGPKGTKRKRDLQSANSSTSQTDSRRKEAIPVDVDNDEGQATRRVAVLASSPPRKKRRILSDSESPPARKPSTHQEKKRPNGRNGGGRLQSRSNEEEGEGPGGGVVDEPFRAIDEEEERVVEIPLSDVYLSPGINNESRDNSVEVEPQNGQLDRENQQTKDKQKIKAILLRQEEEEEESDEIQFLDEPHQSNVAPTIHAGPSKKSPMTMPQPPPQKSPPSNKHRKSATTIGPPKLGSKPLNKPRPVATNKKKTKESSLVAQSTTRLKPPLFEPDSDSNGSSPPDWHKKPTTKRPRIEAADVISIQDSDDAASETRFSPAMRQRLAIFDAEVLGKKTKIAEKKGVNGHELSALERSGSSGNGRPTTSAVRVNQRFDTQSCSMDVVPETELENSQEDKLPPLNNVNSHEKRDDVSPIASSAGPSSKPLRHIPQISPSTFHAHLHPPNSSLPDSIIEPTSSHERRPDIEAIEQFESPEKERFVFKKSIFLLNKNDVVPEARMEPSLELTMNQQESSEEVRESEVVPRGQEIIERTEAMRRRVSAGGAESTSEMTKKKSVQEVVARAESRAHRESNASKPDENDDDEHQLEEEGVADASTSVVPPASGPPALSQEQPPLVDMPQPEDNPNDGDVDVCEQEDFDKTHEDVAVTSAWIDPEFLRQEEEESTQDIVAERRQHQERVKEEEKKEKNPNEDQDPSPIRTPSPRPVLVNGDTEGPNTLVPAEEPKLSSRPSSRSPQKGNQQDDLQIGPITRSRSRSRTPSVVTTPRKNARGKKKALKIPSPVPSQRESAEPEPQVDVVVQNVQEALTASSVLAGQISSLQTEVHEKQAEVDSLQQVLDSLREELRNSEARKAVIEADSQKQITELQSQWADDKSAWEAERTLLATQNSVSEQSKIQAEQDREFIREQYANASAYVTAVREENKVLEQRVRIAEEQSKKGVELIKATFELQVAKLQDETKAWRKMAEFAIQKDIQTNDDIRKRAAEEPELRMLCLRQKKSLNEARVKTDELQADLLEKTSLCDASMEEVEHCKKENARLHSDLNEALIKLDRLGRAGDESTQGDDHEFVYRCMWRVEADNTQSGCPDVFSTMRELEQHLLTGHLAPH